MKVETFAVEKWMDDHETTCKYNIAETCCASVTLQELSDLSDSKSDPGSFLDASLVQGYWPIRGQPALLENLANLYSARAATRLSPDNILITPGAIAANFLVLYRLIEPGDHVVCQYPTYQQLYSVPATLGAHVDLWKCHFEKQWQPDFGELKSMIRENTKLLILNIPQNPTGAIIKRPLLKQIVELAEERNIKILCDEVYRPLFHGISPMDEDFPLSIMSMGYKNVIATGSLSKAYSLAGIRVGWVASRDRDLIEAFEQARQYMHISVSHVDQAVAAFALSPDTMHALLGRNLQLAKTNLAVLGSFITANSDTCQWVKPTAGTTAFVKFSRDGQPIDAVDFCTKLQDISGVMFLPGDYGFGAEFAGFVRIGFVQRTEILSEGLAKVQDFLKFDYASVRTAR